MIDVGFAEIVAHKEQRSPGELGGRVRHAVTEVEIGLVPPFAVSTVGSDGFTPMNFSTRNLLDAELVQDPLQQVKRGSRLNRPHLQR
jgi:hypothetical protein